MTSSKKNEGVEHGVFEKNGQTFIALSLDDAVRLRFDGWEEVQPAAPENLPPETPPSE